jgi:MoaA/NifB/PqqE/SkfB family radical SAM enzyme
MINEPISIKEKSNSNSADSALKMNSGAPEKSGYSFIYNRGFSLAELFIRFRIVKIAWPLFKNKKLMLSVLEQLDQFRRSLLGDKRIRKIVKIGGSWYWDMYTPGTQSPAFEKCIESEIGRIVPLSKTTNRLSNVILAITKKCPLQCAHCFEWEELNKRDTLDADQLHSIVDKIQSIGSNQIFLSGGEPMMKMDLMIDLIKKSAKETDFWVLTSGYQCTEDNMHRLKKAGLTGVSVSLDHYIEEFHNEFRGNSKSFDWVRTAVDNAQKAKLVTALSICVTRAFVTESNLMQYMDLAREMGVAFVQILEPRDVGHFAGQDVLLTEKEFSLLEQIQQNMNYEEEYRSYPIITYHGYYQRRAGCFGAGVRSLYIDTDGFVHACTFCQNKSASVLETDWDIILQKLGTRGCHSFKIGK